MFFCYYEHYDVFIGGFHLKKKMFYTVHSYFLKIFCISRENYTTNIARYFVNLYDSSPTIIFYVNKMQNILK